MGETKETKQDITPNKEEPSAGGPGTTSKEPAKTYTESEFEKAVSDALTKAGRTDKELDDRKASLDAQQAEIDDAKAEIAKIQEQIDQAELEAAEGDPAKLRELQAKKSYKELLAKLEGKEKELKKKETELNRREAEHESKIKATEETQLEIELWKIAEAEGIKAEDLKDAMKDLNLTTVEQAKALAKRLKAGKPAGEFDPDSLVTSGGKTMPDRAKDKIKAGFEELHK